jgi:uncharacterized protein YebE (UPF0316 family)
MIFDYWGYVFLPLLIFVARIADVSIGTIRIIFVSKGLKYFAPLLGFFEVLIWIIAITKIMTHAENFIFYLAYAGGFATGNLVGMEIEKKLSIGKVIVRLISSRDTSKLAEILKKANYPLTVINGKGKSGKVKLLFLVIDRKESRKVIETIEDFDPKAFYSIEDVRYAKDCKSHLETGKIPKFFGFYRKSK